MLKLVTGSGSKRHTSGGAYKSKIFWKITAGIFASILLIEAILLVYSWFTERNRLFSRIDESIAVLVNSLDPAEPVAQLRELVIDPVADSNFTLLGFTYLSNRGEQSSFGDLQASPAPENDKFGIASDESRSYTSRYVRKLEDGRLDTYTLKIDSSWITSYMKKYVGRILGMIVLISLFVTGTCLIFLNPLLVGPLRRLHKTLEIEKKSDISKAAIEDRDLQRNDELGSVFRSFVDMQDTIVKSEIENQLVTQRFEQFANMGADCFWEIDSEYNLSFAAGDYEQILSSNIEELLGQSAEKLFSKISSNNSDYSSDDIFTALLNDGRWEGKAPTQANSADPLYIRMIANIHTDHNGSFVGARGTIIDTTTETELADKLEFQAGHDELTGLANRRTMHERLDVFMDDYSSENKVCSLLVLDLDQFKEVNDSAGHAAGDAMLVQVAEQLTSFARPEDIVVRQGGDEFSIVMPGLDTDAAFVLASNIRASIEDTNLVWEKNIFQISASIGIAETSSSVSTKEALLYAADSSCLRAKRSGKNKIILHDHDSGTDEYRDEAQWISRIINAVEVDEFVLFKQTIVRINCGNEGRHFEILLRMKNPEGGFYPPNLFLPVAERNDLMPLIDKWVVSHAYAWLEKQAIPADNDYCMNINISANSLADADFCEFLVDIVGQYRKINEFVCFEVTESAAMTCYEQTIRLLKVLKENGCSIALDDFGTGYSSLSHIRELPLDYIKIDGCFIQQIHNNVLDQTVVRGVAEIAKVLRIKTVAEFVDSEEALQYLENLEIDYAQGFLFSKPVELIDDDSDQFGYKAA